MKIAILTNNFPPILDGVGDYSAHLAAEFQRNGHEVSVICREDARIVQATATGAFGIPVSASIPAWNHKAVKPLRQFIEIYEPDWILVQYVPNSFQCWAMPIWLPVLLWMTKQRGIRVGIVFHEVYIRIRFWPLKYWFVGLVQRLICMVLTLFADVLITSIDLYTTFLRTKSNKPVHILPIPSSIPPVPITEVDLLAIRQNTLAPNSEQVISTFGLRNQDVVLRVFEQVLHYRPTTRLLICSNLNISAACESLYETLKHLIIVTGFMEAADVYRHLRASDVYFLPDHTDKNGKGGTCNKSAALAAGLGAGLPVVGITGDMNNALLLKTPGMLLSNWADENSIVNNLLQHLSNTQREALRQEITRFSTTNLSWKTIARTQLTLMNQFDTSRL